MSKTANTMLIGECGSVFFPWLRPGILEYCYPAALPDPALRQLLSSYDRVIFFDWVAPQILLNPVFLQPHHAKTYVFYWNPVEHSLFLQESYEAYIAALKRFHTLCSFQPEDCLRYGMQFNSTMYASPPEALRTPLPLVYDLVFAGRAKDRLPLLRTIYQSCCAQGLRTHFFISKNHFSEYQAAAAPNEQRPGWVYIDACVAYDAYLHWLRASRAVLDIYQSGQTGYSLRVMEHLFFGKKLVTNNRSIRRESFFHPNNIFILDEDDMDGLAAWLSLPFVPADDTIKAYYSIEQWIERFN